MSCFLVGSALGNGLPSGPVATATSGESPAVATKAAQTWEPSSLAYVDHDHDAPLVVMSRADRERLREESLAQKQHNPLVKTYTVREGDSLWSIADEHHTDLETLIALNDDIEFDLIQPGQTLRVVSDFYGITYLVQDGDTLEQVAVSHRLTAEEIRRANALASNEEPASGTVLFLPGARPREARPVVASRSGATRREAVSVSPAPAPAPAPAAVRTAAPAPKPASTWLWPIAGGLHSSEYGPRWGGFHGGLDIAVPAGTPAVAARGGVVTFAGWDGGYGFCVIIDHGDGIKTRYAHASALLVSTGEAVDQGQAVIRVGSTGNSTGDHLHFEVIVNGREENPRNYLP